MPTTTPAPESDVQDFANMSAALTGFLSSVLKPALDPVGLARTYYEFALTQDAATMTALLAAYRKIQTQPPQTIADTLLEITPPDKTPPKTAPVTAPPPSPQALFAESIVAMWYLGAWYIPGVQGGGGFPPTPLKIVSSEAYTNGLVWKVMQSHPMGFSPFTFGYWSQPPGPLSSFGVNTGGGQ